MKIPPTFVDRARTTAFVWDLLPATATIAAGPPDDLPAADLRVTVDADDDRLAAAAAGGGILAVVVASEVATNLIATARADRERASSAASRPDPYGRALAWAAARAELELAPAISVERIVQLTARLDAAGLVLVEPPVDAFAPGLARFVGTTRTPLERAIFAVVALGATARPLLFVPRARAPKAATPKVRLDRVADLRIARGPVATAGPTDTPLLDHALAVLAAEDRAVPFKELLRMARDAGRLPAGSDDTKILAAALLRAERDDGVGLHPRV